MWKHAVETDRHGHTRSALHYDHNERGGYLGFTHAHHNRTAGARKGQTISAATKRARQQWTQPRRSRIW